MSSLVLKLIAAVSMLIDHAGLMLFDNMPIMRVIGRLAFPIYAYCIAEGFRYTRNRLRYFLQVFLLGLVCQIVYTIADRTLYLGILIVFSISIIIMYFADCAKTASRGSVSSLNKVLTKLLGRSAPFSADTDRTISYAFTAAAILGALLLSSFVSVDYGFFGIMLPVFTSLFEDKPRRLVMFSASLMALCIVMTETFPIQYWSLGAIPIIALYNGKPGKYRLKYFFYIFYPAHLAVLYGLQMLLK